MTPARVEEGKDYWYSEATVSRCSRGSVGCRVGDHGEIAFILHCEDATCSVRAPMATSDMGPDASLTNDGTGTWSGTYPAVPAFECEGTPVPSRNTIRLHVVSAQWMPYSGRFQATRLEGQVEAHGDAGGGCGSITVTYEVTAGLH